MSSLCGTIISHSLIVFFLAWLITAVTNTKFLETCLNIEVFALQGRVWLFSINRRANSLKVIWQTIAEKTCVDFVLELCLRSTHWSDRYQCLVCACCGNWSLKNQSDLKSFCVHSSSSKLYPAHPSCPTFYSVISENPSVVIYYSM